MYAQHIIHSLQERGVQKWVALSEGQGGSIGWLTTNERKEVRGAHPMPAGFEAHAPAPSQAMVFQLRDALRVGNIFLSEEFFSVLMEEREAIKVMRDELCRFAIITEPAKTLFGRVRKTYTGKIGGLQDDLAICLCVAPPTPIVPMSHAHTHAPLHRQLAITGLRCFYQSSKYDNFRIEL